MQQGSTNYNFARQCALRAGPPTSVARKSVDRQCASGMMAIVIAANEIIVDGMRIAVGGRLESMSLVQNDKMTNFRAHDPWLRAHRDDVYMSMLETAEIVAERHKVSREKQDELALQSHQRAAAARAGRAGSGHAVAAVNHQAVGRVIGRK